MPPHPEPLVRSGSRTRSSATMLLGAVPSLLLSLLILFVVGVLLAPWVAIVIAVLWLFFGVMVFDATWFTPNRAKAAKMFGLRPPISPETELLAAAWENVTRRPGVDGWPYALYIEESPELNALAGPSRIVAVTDWAAANLRGRQLEALLAHELGHHITVDPRIRLLVLWVGLPSRLIWRVCRLAGRTVSFAGSLAPVIRLVVGLALLPVIIVVLAPALGRPAALVLAVLLVVEPLVRAAASRWDEFAADAVAADLGYGRELVAGLKRAGRGEPRLTGLSGVRYRLFHTHPPDAVRIRAIKARSRV